ncbi:efflux RND transporter periplasmic adaptor subunit [Shewanella dokdonensis]|uniref:Efflux RND transporter periplasmic adaptor subunit n=2 Tax=Shewanella dokdonensis TaxID=712036 RepID=A0ABX8DID4_9GAMM|nr:efflux RND transporter periplasmic adaptor subunit [Shewanella dokdonensis]MCL1076559.1 efflux RND transporter periplasmic adaptor subunit [Shewanella dokdonensis]QVK24120.1 efflux RND transporter periplasmic adaptor subunit [Shewanella dokdonensis]QVK24543.1 efflux RND transporter periplasmic adaptor subunit [Shewanella dokdonensis]
MSNNHKRRQLACVLSLVLATGSQWSLQAQALTNEHPQSAQQTSAAAQGAYYCPMHPQERSDKPGRCPICGMFLVKDDATEPKQSPAEPKITAPTGAASQPAMVMPGDKPMTAQQASNTQKVFSQVDTAQGSHGGTIKYVCPMHPQIVMDAPGTCPICGMTLQKVEMGGQQDTVKVEVSGQIQQALALKVAKASRQTMWRSVNTVGEVGYDESQITHIHSRVSGWIEKLTVQSSGDEIKKGQLLYEIYSPELVNAQDDYLLAQDTLKRSGNSERYQELLRKAGLRLELLGLTQGQIQQLAKSGKTQYRVPFYAESSGFVKNLDIRDGMYLQPATEILSMVDLDKVWVIADVFENEQSWLAVGQPADVSIPAMGIKALQGKIDYIYPELDPVTRSLRVRVVLPNNGEHLRPNTLAKVSLFGGANENALVIPQEALIQTGKENRVIVQAPDHSFTARRVDVGMMSRGMVQILSGLNDGESVVLSGQFLLDSEASLKGSLMRLSNQHQEAHNAEDHH